MFESFPWNTSYYSTYFYWSLNFLTLLLGVAIHLLSLFFLKAAYCKCNCIKLCRKKKRKATMDNYDFHSTGGPEESYVYDEGKSSLIAGLNNSGLSSFRINRNQGGESSDLMPRKPIRWMRILGKSLAWMAWLTYAVLFNWLQAFDYVPLMISVLLMFIVLLVKLWD